MNRLFEENWFMFNVCSMLDLDELLKPFLRNMHTVNSYIRRYVKETDKQSALILSIAKLKNYHSLDVNTKTELIKKINYLINIGTNVNYISNIDDGRRYETPLIEIIDMFEAQLSGEMKKSIIENILDAGVDINRNTKHIINWIPNSTELLYTTYNWTALHYAVKSGDIDVVKMLLDYGADINATDFNNTTPLYYAVNNINSSMVKILLEYGADPNIRRNSINDYCYVTPTPLCCAVATEENYKKMLELRKIIKYLLDSGANTKCWMCGHAYYCIRECGSEQEKQKRLKQIMTDYKRVDIHYINIVNSISRKYCSLDNFIKGLIDIPMPYCVLRSYRMSGWDALDESEILKYCADIIDKQLKLKARDERVKASVVFTEK